MLPETEIHTHSNNEVGAPQGRVLSSYGSHTEIRIVPDAQPASDRMTIGKFVAISCGRSTVIGMITDIRTRAVQPSGSTTLETIATADLVGEIEQSRGAVPRFQRGVRNYPAIGDTVSYVSRDELELIYSPTRSDALTLGELQLDSKVPVTVDGKSLISKHFAILGSTGVGKSSGTAVIVSELIENLPDVHITLLDLHDEYGECFGDSACVIDADNLRLPFWLLNLEEFSDVIFGGKPAVAEELEILAELIPIAKGMYRDYKSTSERSLLSRRTVRNGGCSADTPVPYVIQDLIGLIDERMGKLENRGNRMAHHHLIQRIDGIRNDPRYSFMFENANVGGDTMVAVLNQLFRLSETCGNVTILKLASLPGEVVDAVVCVTTRLGFEFGIWSKGGIPILLICEEAHRYASRDRSVGFAPVRQALSRIAKEGRKYGIYLGLVTQRPAEIDPTIISQCSTLFFMRMANEEDQSVLRSAVSDSGRSHLSFVPSLGLREVIGIGEAMPMPARFSFRELPASMKLGSDNRATLGHPQNGADRDKLISEAVESWRKSTVEKSHSGRARNTLGETGEDEAAFRSGQDLRLINPVTAVPTPTEPKRYVARSG